MLSKDLEAGYSIPGDTYGRDKGNNFKDIIGSTNKKYFKIPGYSFLIVEKISTNYNELNK